MNRPRQRRVVHSITANVSPYILVWNPERWPWKEHAEEVRESKRGKVVPGNRSCGIRKNYEIGGRIFLYRVADNQGIVASGTVSGETYPELHWDGSGREIRYVPIDFDKILELHEILPRDQLEAEVPFDWRHLLGSGKQVPAEAAGKLENLWKRHLKAIGRA